MFGQRFSLRPKDEFRVRTGCAKLHSNIQRLSVKTENLAGKKLAVFPNLNEVTTQRKSLNDESMQPILKEKEEADEDSVILKLNELLSPKKSLPENIFIFSKAPARLVIKKSEKIKVSSPALKY